MSMSKYMLIMGDLSRIGNFLLVKETGKDRKAFIL
jgi:hypothetical protein